MEGLEEDFFRVGITFKKKRQDHEDMQSFKLTEDDEYKCKYINRTNETVFNVLGKSQQRKQTKEVREDTLVTHNIHAIVLLITVYTFL